LIGGIGATLRQARIAKAAQLQAETEKSEAQSQRNRAEAALTTADERRQQAEAARNEADQQRNEAEAQRTFAEEQQLRAESQELSNRRLLYTSQMALANTAWNESNVGRVLELLTAQIPKPSEPDLRGFEWHYLWRISHTEIATLQQPSFSSATAFSSDGRQLISITRDGTIKQWDTLTWKEVASSKWKSLGSTFSPTFSADRKLAAAQRVSGRETKTSSIGIWEVSTGKLLKSLVPTVIPAVAARSFAFSVDGKYLAIGFYQGQIVIFEIATGKEVLNFQGRSQQVNGLAYSPDGTKLVSNDLDGLAKLWDVRSGKELMTYRSTSTAAYSPDGRFWAAGGQNESVMIRDLKTNKDVKTLGSQKGVMSVVFSPDGKKLAAGGVDLQIRVWETETWNELAIIKGHGNPINTLIFSDDGQKLVSGSRDGIVKVWDLARRQTPPTYCGSKGISDIAFTPDGSKLIVASPDQSFTIQDIVTGSEVYSRRAHNKDEKTSGLHPLILLLAPDRERLMTRGDDGLAFWSISNGKELLRMIPRVETGAMALTSDSRLLATSYRGSGDIQIWEARTGNELFRLHVEAPNLNGMVFLPDNRTLVTGFDDLVFLDMRTHQEVKKVRTNSRAFFSMKLSPDGRTIAVGSNLGSVSLHNATTGKEIFTLKGHGSAINDLAFSPDGKRLASSSVDSTRLWDLTTGQEVFTLPPAYKIAFSPNGRQLAATWGGNVRLYSTVEIGNINANCR
ncbi:MAG TPA: hypothetical protein PLQ88_08565, partial [Blastocatellia bacterium]|nr:hypothetical protein [Blastocatellia bacterium]